MKFGQEYQPERLVNVANMKIVFLCGSLEPGHDGVGDYTRLLAKSLIEQGHLARLVALNDRHLEIEFDGIQTAENVTLPVLRLPSRWSIREKLEYAKKWIDQFNPDWLSLQYVIFSFHDKGLPIEFNRQLKYLGQSRNWHIMFHELSVGLNKETSFKEKCWGRLQRTLIRRLIKKINPRVVHTQSKLYQTYLEQYYPDVQHLPLFSNIPVIKTPVSTRDIKTTCNPYDILIVIFGPIFRGGAVQVLAREVAQYGRNNNKNICLQLVGRSGKESKFWSQIFEAEGVDVKLFGEQPAARISAILTNASVGISTTPILLIEKSGTAAAMIEHGLPVLCVSHQWTPIEAQEITFIEGVASYSKGMFETFILTAKHKLNTTRIGEVSTQFVNALIHSK